MAAVSILRTVLTGWAAVALLMTLLWYWQTKSRNAGIVDVAWSLTTGLLGVWFASIATGYMPRRVLVMVLVAGWSARLGLYLLRRVLSEREDGRYNQLRASWGDAADRKLFIFFQIQAVWAVMFAAPMYAAASNATRGLGLLDLAGALVAFISIQGEMLADRQLARFRKNPENRGRVCQEGLWRYSRHPNYFFEWLHWWAYLLIAAGSPYWWIAVLGVVVMLLFLTKVTGIPPTERQAIRSRGDAYRQYQQTTSAFFPWPPKSIG